MGMRPEAASLAARCVTRPLSAAGAPFVGFVGVHATRFCLLGLQKNILPIENICRPYSGFIMFSHYMTGVACIRLFKR
jgi:hypothetical protein